jgi:hypothetical protein
VELNIEHRTSNIEHRTPNIQHRTSNTEHPTSNIEGMAVGKPRAASEEQQNHEDKIIGKHASGA